MNARQITAATNRINRGTLYKLANHHNQIPLQEMMDACKANGLMPIQEDGTEWSGFCCGLTGEIRIDLMDMDKFENHGDYLTFSKHSNHLLCVSWCQMPSGRYEVHAYVS